ncbi:hypothetical protein ACC785_39170, partial [Rhizobium ruizarguesonis]
TIDRQVIARAASFLLLAASQATYQIEGERPPLNRLELWMRAVAQAGRRPLSIDELEQWSSEGSKFLAVVGLTLQKHG